MNIIKSIFVFFTLSLITYPLNGQIFGNDPEYKIDDVAVDNIWQITEMAIIEHSIKPGVFNIKEGVLVTDWIEWESIAVKNRARLHIKISSSTITIKIADRQFKTKDGWSEAIGNLSKKKYSEYVVSVANKIREILNDNELIKKAVINSKLIPCFKAINFIDPIEWKLTGIKPLENGNLSFTFEVKNSGLNPVKIWPQMGFLFDKVQSEKSDVRLITTGWSVTGRDREPTITILQPSEVLTVTFGILSNKTWATGTISKLRIKIQYNSESTNLKFLELFNVPIPY